MERRSAGVASHAAELRRRSFISRFLRGIVPRRAGHFQHLLCDFKPVHRDQDIIELAATGGLEDLALVGHEREPQVWVSQCVACDDCVYVPRFSLGLPKELETGWNSSKQMLNGNYGSGGAATSLLKYDLAGIHSEELADRL